MSYRINKWRRIRKTPGCQCDWRDDRIPNPSLPSAKICGSKSQGSIRSGLDRPISRDTERVFLRLARWVSKGLLAQSPSAKEQMDRESEIWQPVNEVRHEVESVENVASEKCKGALKTRFNLGEERSQFQWRTPAKSMKTQSTNSVTGGVSIANPKKREVFLLGSES